MSKKIDETSGWLQRFAAWVDGDRERRTGRCW